MPPFDLRLAWMRWFNRVDYPLRQFFRWQRPGFRRRRQGSLRARQNARVAEGLFEHLSGRDRERAERLAEQYFRNYHLRSLSLSTTPGNYRENLFYLDLLVGALERSGCTLPTALDAADIGPSHWFYVQALHAGLTWWRAAQERTVRLTGFEADAYRVYSDLYSRFDHAMGHVRGLEGVEYLDQAFTPQAEAFDLITMFFPFVFEKDHLEWGLPHTMFQPQRLVEDAYNSLKPGGVLIVANQGEQEHTAQREMLRQLGITPACAYRQESLFFRYQIDRYVLAARRE
jgi:SAM-dependent methyltransferase